MSPVPGRVAVLSFWDPWEAPHGGTLRTRAFCEAFAALGSDVTCLYPASPSSTPARVDGVERVPVAGQTVGHQRWPPPVQRLKRMLLPMPTALGARSPALVEALSRRAPFDLLVVSHLTAVQYREAAGNPPLWLDQSDLWSSFARREADARRGPARLTARWQGRSIAGREEAAVRAAAVITAAGWSDASELRDRTGAAVHWLPTALPAASGGAPDRTAGPPTVGYLANFAYHPNVDALAVLVAQWLPALRARGWRIVVARLESDRVTVPSGVEVLGAVDDVDDFYREVDATVAPVRLGGGMKVKVVESLLKGRPVLATSFAVDGFPPEVRAHTSVVDLHDPVVPGPDTLAPVELPAAVRRTFTREGFTDLVAGALSSR